MEKKISLRNPLFEGTEFCNLAANYNIQAAVERLKKIRISNSDFNKNIVSIIEKADPTNVANDITYASRKLHEKHEYISLYQQSKRSINSTLVLGDNWSYDYIVQSDILELLKVSKSLHESLSEYIKNLSTIEAEDEFQVYSDMIDIFNEWLFDGKTVIKDVSRHLCSHISSLDKTNINICFVDCDQKYVISRINEICQVIAICSKKEATSLDTEEDTFVPIISTYSKYIVSSLKKKTFIIDTKIYKSISEVCYSVPIDFNASAYDGQEIYCTPLCYESINKGIIFFDYDNPYIAYDCSLIGTSKDDLGNTSVTIKTVESGICKIASKLSLSLYIPEARMHISDIFRAIGSNSRFSEICRWCLRTEKTDLQKALSKYTPKNQQSFIFSEFNIKRLPREPNVNMIFDQGQISFFESNIKNNGNKSARQLIKEMASLVKNKRKEDNNIQQLLKY